MAVAPSGEYQSSLYLSFDTKYEWTSYIRHDANIGNVSFAKENRLVNGVDYPTDEITSASNSLSNHSNDQDATTDNDCYSLNTYVS